MLFYLDKCRIRPKAVDFAAKWCCDCPESAAVQIVWVLRVPRTMASYPRMCPPTAQLLEACVMNCGAKFHTQLAYSDTWQEMSRMADPKRRVC